MSDWREELATREWQIKEVEKKRNKEQREKDKAERLRAEDRYRCACRKVFGLPGETPDIIRSRKPINREAGRLVQKASEWAKPPVEQQQQPTKKQKGKHMSDKGKLSERDSGPSRELFQGSLTKTATGAPLKSNSGIPRDANPNEYFNINEIALRIIERINQEPHQLTALARAAVDARAVLDENIKLIGPVMEDFNARVKVALEDMRQSRFAVVGEIAHLLQPLKEVRAFLLGKDYQFEVTRLKEFCDLCERLVKLKKDGTLDAIADTIIKLA